jgi:N-acetylmuramoyl-L-alanine amidase
MDKRVFIAVGHGRRPDGTIDPGARNTHQDGRKSEQSEGHIIVHHLAGFLRQADVWVEAQRSGDPNFAGVEGYTQRANRLGVDLALTVHHDWHAAPRGFFCHWSGGAGPDAERDARRRVNKRAADAIYAAVEQAGSFPLRPSWHKQRDDLTFCTRARVPSVLIECDRIGEVRDHEGLARAIANGVLDHLGVPRTAAQSITVGDHGRDVTSWQQTLDRLYPGHRAAGRPTGVFDADTLERTCFVLDAAGLTAAEPARPRVGAVTREAAERLLREPWAGKRVRAKTEVRYYGQPGWHPQNAPAGLLDGGKTFSGGIIQLRKVGAGRQYEVFTRDATKRFWVTASPTFVDLID